MIEALPGLIGIGIFATAGVLIVRSFNARRGRSGSSNVDSTGYWSGSDISGPGAASTRDSDRDSGGWFSGLFSSSGDSSESSSSDSGGGDGGGGGD